MLFFQEKTVFFASLLESSQGWQTTALEFTKPRSLLAVISLESSGFMSFMTLSYTLLVGVWPPPEIFGLLKLACEGNNFAAQIFLLMIFSLNLRIKSSQPTQSSASCQLASSGWYPSHSTRYCVLRLNCLCWRMALTLYCGAPHWSISKASGPGLTTPSQGDNLLTWNTGCTCQVGGRAKQ